MVVMPDNITALGIDYFFYFLFIKVSLQPYILISSDLIQILDSATHQAIVYLMFM